MKQNKELSAEKQCDIHVVMPSFTEDDLDSVWQDYKYYIVQILNKEYKLEEAIEDLRSLIGSEYDPRN